MSKRETLPKMDYEPAAQRKARVTALLRALHTSYPDARCALEYDSPYQLLIATILSAQCTDARVNIVTRDLFAAYPDAFTMAEASLADIERLVKPTGFYRQKAKNILATAQIVAAEYDGELLPDINMLTKLPGAARKTANVVISNCFPEYASGIAVDTHVQRIARRMRITSAWETNKIEQELMKALPKDEWNHITHILIDHGRAVCKAPTPVCKECPISIASLCPSRGRWDS